MKYVCFRFDPEERIRFRNLLSEFADGRIVLLSTHIASDIESTCGGVGVLNEGKLIFTGRTEDIQYRVLSNVPPKEGISEKPTLEDGYMYLLQQAKGGIY